MRKISSIIISLVFILNTAFGYTQTVTVKGVDLVVTTEPGNTVEIQPKLPEISGWKVNSGNITITNNQFVMPEENVEIEAIIEEEPETYLLTVDTPLFTQTEEKTEGEVITVTAISSDNYLFTNWNATGITLTEEQQKSETITFTMPNANVDIEAIIENASATYTISYDANNGTGAPEAQPKTAGETLTLSSIVPTRDGYNFLGWATTSTATEAEYQPGGSFTLDANTTLYAVWEEALEWNRPFLGTELTPVNWNGTEWVATDEANWDYNYDLASTWSNSVGSNTYGVEGDGTARWANAKDSNGSLYVWIPRFTYYTYEGDSVSWNSDTSGTARTYILFSDGIEDHTTDESGETYNKHSAFTLTDASGNTTEITGFWVGKYEASEGSNSVPESKPEVIAWGGDSTSDMYEYAKDLNGTNSQIGAHMLKESEWGAVAYLTSAIGRIPYISARTTGTSANTWDANLSYAGTYSLWNTEKGVRGSTTHNIYGIYDMNGGKADTVAVYPVFYDEVTVTYNANLMSSYNTYGTKYVDFPTQNEEDYARLGWDEDNRCTLSKPSIKRGGYWSSGERCGIFSIYQHDGAAESMTANNSFRIALFGVNL